MLGYLGRFRRGMIRPKLRRHLPDVPGTALSMANSEGSETSSASPNLAARLLRRRPKYDSAPLPVRCPTAMAVIEMKRTAPRRLQLPFWPRDRVRNIRVSTHISWAARACRVVAKAEIEAQAR